MDTNDLRALFTMVTFVMFICILWWAFSGKRKQAFDEAALLPFTDEEPEAGNTVRQGKSSAARQ